MGSLLVKEDKVLKRTRYVKQFHHFLKGYKQGAALDQNLERIILDRVRKRIVFKEHIEFDHLLGQLGPQFLSFL